MHALPQDHTGVRIARLRRERHLTQQALADLSGVPYNTLTKIEQGRLESTPHSVACFARAMRVEVSTIVGQPYKDDLRADELDGLIAPIRWALDAGMVVASGGPAGGRGRALALVTVLLLTWPPGEPAPCAGRAVRMSPICRGTRAGTCVCAGVCEELPETRCRARPSTRGPGPARVRFSAGAVLWDGPQRHER
ncbi:helix-turn-helix domain-containing protein [Streptomyces sp. NPDC058637]|uniref:helix-turn-helix domain-containing protein n=1 Tax=Streptomyces sp. NPDC058637 TaxID=3346569 RepID=UPI00365AFFA3